MHANAALLSQRSPSEDGFSMDFGLIAFMLPSMKLEHSDRINGLDETGTPIFANSSAYLSPTTLPMFISSASKNLLHVHKLTNTGARDSRTRSAKSFTKSYLMLSSKTKDDDIIPSLLQ